MVTKGIKGPVWSRLRYVERLNTNERECNPMAHLPLSDRTVRCKKGKQAQVVHSILWMQALRYTLHRGVIIIRRIVVTVYHQEVSRQQEKLRFLDSGLETFDETSGLYNVQCINVARDPQI